MHFMLELGFRVVGRAGEGTRCGGLVVIGSLGRG